MSESVDMSDVLAQSNKYVVFKSGRRARVYIKPVDRWLEGFEHESAIVCAAISPNEQFVVIGAYDNHASIWRLPSAQLIKRLGHARVVTNAAFSSDNDVVITTSARYLAFWETLTGRRLRVIKKYFKIEKLLIYEDRVYTRYFREGISVPPAKIPKSNLRIALLFLAAVRALDVWNCEEQIAREVFSFLL